MGQHHRLFSKVKEQMPIWIVNTVEDQPELILVQWRIFEIDGMRHFNGYVQANREGRVSSPILEFDPSTMRGRTRSGRVYQLAGKPGFNFDADYVLGQWLKLNQLERDAISFVDPDGLTTLSQGNDWSTTAP